MRPGRIIGVFDDATGRPIEGAVIEDVLSGLHAATTATGTASLFFVDTGGTLVRIRKLGYMPQVFPVANSDRDSIPVTVVLKPAAQVLPTVVTKARSARGPADTVRTLEVNGFYERRNASGAPQSAFVTEEKINRFSLLTDVARLVGTKRGFCNDNLYIDGVKVDVPDLNFGGRRTSKVLKNGIDALLDPGTVAGIEFYKTSDLPPEFNGTLKPGVTPCGATLIWTK